MTTNGGPVAPPGAQVCVPEPAFYTKLAKWVKEEGSGWRPAVLYENYAHVLKYHSTALDMAVKIKFALKIRSLPWKGRPVARFLHLNDEDSPIDEHSFVLMDANEIEVEEEFFAGFGVAMIDKQEHPEHYPDDFDDLADYVLQLVLKEEDELASAPSVDPSATAGASSSTAHTKSRNNDKQASTQATAKRAAADESKKKKNPTAKQQRPHKKPSLAISSSPSSSSSSEDTVDHQRDDDSSKYSLSARSAATYVSVPSYAGAPLLATDDFDTMWTKLATNDWKERGDDEGRTWYLQPKVKSLKKGEVNVTMFTRRQLKEFVKEYYCTNLHIADESDSDDESEDEDVKPIFKEAKNKKKMGKSKKNTESKHAKIAGKKRHRKEDEHAKSRSLKAAKKSRAPSTPPDAPRTKPQDPAKPWLSSPSSSSESSEEDPYGNFNALWADLKRVGWTWAQGTGLHSFYYIRPGRNVKDGKLGVDYFASGEAVIEYMRKEDGREKKKSVLSTGRYRTSSARKKARAAGKLPAASRKEPSKRKARSSSNDDDASPPPTKKKKSRARKQWWHKEPIPHFLDECWPLLQKLDFYYTGGRYKPPRTDQHAHLEFANDSLIRGHLVKNGIPNIERLDEDEKETMERWVKFAYVPVNDCNSVSKLEDIDVWDDEEAWDVLESLEVSKMSRGGGYTWGGDKSKNTTPEHFESLDAIRVYIRSAESLDPPGSGRRRGGSKGSQLSADDTLKLRLWAALSPTPLPTVESAADICMSDEVCRTPEQQTSIAEDPGSANATIHTTEDIMGDESTFSQTQGKGDARRITMDPSDKPAGDPLGFMANQAWN